MPSFVPTFSARSTLLRVSQAACRVAHNACATAQTALFAVVHARVPSYA